MGWLKECLMQALTAKVPSLILSLPAYCFNAEASAHICAIFRRLIEDPGNTAICYGGWDYWCTYEAYSTNGSGFTSNNTSLVLPATSLESLLHLANSCEPWSHENIYADKTIGQHIQALNWQRIVSALMPVPDISDESLSLLYYNIRFRSHACNVFLQ